MSISIKMFGLVFAFIICLVLQSYGQISENCSNGIDDDGDGFVDCQDQDCSFEGFDTGLIYSSSNRIRLIDFDFDGDMDVVGFSSAAVKVMINEGDRKYSGPIVLAQFPSSVKDADFGDLDGDGDFDVFAVTTSNEVLVFLQAVTDVFVDIGFDPLAPDSMDKVVLMDTDQDGDLDAVILAGQFDNGTAGGVVKAYINDGLSSFTETWSRDNIYADQLIELDSGQSTGPYLYLGSSNNASCCGVDHLLIPNGAGSFSVSTQSNNGNGFVAARGNVDQDSAIELLRVNDGSTQVLIGSTVIYTGEISGLDLFDYDQDGDLDLFVGKQILLNDGAGVFSEQGIYTDYSALSQFSEVLDLDGDGLKDFIYGSKSVIYGGDQISLSNEVSLTKFIESEDLNDDGHLDVYWVDREGAFGCAKAVVAFGLGDNAYEVLEVDACFSNTIYRTAGTAFLPDSGRRFIYYGYKSLTTNNNNLLYVTLREVVGNELLPVGGINIPYGQSVAFADFDSDGDLDCFAVRTSNYEATLPYPNAVYFGDGSGSFIDSGQSIGNDRGREIALGDLDNDGDIDVVVGANQSSDLVFLNNGVGQFVSSFSLGRSTDNSFVEIADINNDGFDDIYIGNQDTTDSIYINDQAGGFVVGVNVFEANSENVGFGDLNSDGLVDFCLARNGFVECYLNEGGLQFGPPTSVPYVGQDLSVGDMDNDGALDIAVAGNGLTNKIFYNESFCSLDEDLDGINNPCDVDVTLGPDCDLDGQDDSCQPDGDMDGVIDPCDPDLDNDGISNACDFDHGGGTDCDNNGIVDECDIAQGLLADCDLNGFPDICEYTSSQDCNSNGLLDSCDILVGISQDCSGNGIPDECEIQSGSVADCNSNGVPDQCDYLTDPDCNSNGILDSCDIGLGIDTDCDFNGIPDLCDLLAGADCNSNGVLDACDISGGFSEDCDGNQVPDSCDIDGGAVDDDSNGIPDSCEPQAFRRGDMNADGTMDVSDAVFGLEFLFGLQTVTCEDAADANDDGSLNIGDAVFILSALFNNGDLPPDPGSQSCGLDPTADSLGCEMFGVCP